VSQHVPGVCADCVHDNWTACDECGHLISPDDETFSAERAEGVFCCDECANEADIAAFEGATFWREVASCNARGEAWT
jgi:hypothetical protein